MNPAALAIAFALWAQGLLVFCIALVLYRRRIPRVVRGEIRMADVALDGAAWPQDARQAANAYANQFELPVLFFVAGAGAIWLGAAWWEAALCWVFVFSRFVHAAIHVTSNAVPRRFAAFSVGVLAVLALWLTLGVRLVVAGLS